MSKTNQVANATKTESEIALEKQIAEMKLQLKELQAKSKPERKIKGRMVTFTNQAGETITGYGQLYYVVRMNKKLYYKQQDSVTLLDESTES